MFKLPPLFTVTFPLTIKVPVTTNTRLLFTIKSPQIISVPLKFSLDELLAKCIHVTFGGKKAHFWIKNVHTGAFVMNDHVRLFPKRELEYHFERYRVKKSMKVTLAPPLEFSLAQTSHLTCPFIKKSSIRQLLPFIMTIFAR